ncbi:MAG: hypothetical protein NW226_26980 [Microscillaceae bacterium]|nr:hypothetical protein [Microscillaceae bacterium]
MIQKIEDEINFLTKKRSQLFDEWIYLVKKNDREFELNGFINDQATAKAELLLKEQKSIGKKIMTLLQKADSMTSD